MAAPPRVRLKGAVTSAGYATGMSAEPRPRGITFPAVGAAAAGLYVVFGVSAIGLSTAALIGVLPGMIPPQSPWTQPDPAMTAAGAGIIIFMACSIVLICSIVGLLPAAVWAATASVFGRRLYTGRTGLARGALLGLLLAIPAELFVLWLDFPHWLEIERALMIGTAAGAAVAGAVLAKALRGRPA